MERSNIKKDRENTEKRLLNALGEIISENGFEKVGVNSIATKAGVSKVLIYRYFGSIDNMIIEYLSQNDFWISFSIDIPKDENLRSFIKGVFSKQIRALRENVVMQRMLRWELTEKNDVLEKVRLKREANGVAMIAIINQLTKSSQNDLASIATILSAAISYLVLLSENSSQYNGIDIQSDKGWEQIAKGIDKLVDLWYDNKD